MKRAAIYLLTTLLTISLSAKSRAISNPEYELKSSGITNIAKIELSDEKTVIHVHCTFIPHWWVKFPTKTFIQDSETKEKIYATKIENGEFDKEIYMPDSGDSTFVLVFPPLSKSIKKIDYGEEDKVEVWGISLSKTHKTKPNTLNPKIQIWIDAELQNSKKKNLTDYDSPEFFTQDNARLIGCIKGYDPRLGFSTGIIYLSNELTNEDLPLTIEIQPDGRFDVRIPVDHPKCIYLILEKLHTNIYVEPGHTLALIMDWNEFLTADRLRNIRYEFKDVNFLGTTAQINKELYENPIKKLDYNLLNEYTKTLSPEEFKEKQLIFIKESTEELEKTIAANNFLPQTQRILRNDLLLSNIYNFFDFTMYKRWNNGENPASEALVVNNDYFSFLSDMPFNDPTLAIPHSFGVFINRFEYCDLFNQIKRTNSCQSFYDFVFSDGSLALSDDDLFYRNVLDSIDNSLEISSDIRTLYDSFAERYKQYKNDFDKHIDRCVILDELTCWKAKDKVLENNFNIASIPNFVYETAKVRSLKYFLRSRTKDASREYLTQLQSAISYPLLLTESERMFREIHPDNKTAYQIPEGKAGDIFRKIIEPHKGKFLFVDFWGIFCGSCISGIKNNKELRNQHKNNPDFDFIFITSDDNSPKDRYESFVKEQELEHSYYLTADEYRYMRELFKFNGIPRYVIIDRDGRVEDDNAGTWRFNEIIKKITTEKE